MSNLPPSSSLGKRKSPNISIFIAYLNGKDIDVFTHVDTIRWLICLLSHGIRTK